MDVPAVTGMSVTPQIIYKDATGVVSAECVNTGHSHSDRKFRDDTSLLSVNCFIFDALDDHGFSIPIHIIIWQRLYLHIDRVI
ncbi:hypothetical protein TNCV_2171781 [Trichonephila clavipes]|nr:hypothetical protein TNCV_2171781 [Trichonephila clavipes]